MRAEEPSESHVPKIHDRGRNTTPILLPKNSHIQEAERCVCVWGGGFPKTWPAVPAVGGFEKNLFLGESHQGWGQPSSVHLRKSIPEHLGGI